MSWVQEIAMMIGSSDYSNPNSLAPDIAFNLEELFTYTVLTDDQIEGCALAAAVASGHHLLWNVIYNSPYPAIGRGYVNIVERRAGVQAGALASQNNVYFNYAEQFEPLKSIPDRMRGFVAATNGGTTKDRFDSYMLAGHLVGPCNMCITAYTIILKEQGYGIEQLRDIGRIASVMKAVSNMYPAYIPPPPQEQYTGI